MGELWHGKGLDGFNARTGMSVCVCVCVCVQVLLFSRFKQGEEFLYHSIEVKNIWLPMGEIFAN